MNQKFSTYDMAYIAMCTVLIAICSWISIPTTVPFTLQTFAIFISVILLDGKRGTIAVALYILLGAIGIPVFAGFSGGVGVISGATGGYIIGFLGTALIMWAFEAFMGTGKIARIASMLLGLLVCYTIGTVWFMIVYARNSGPVGIGTVLGWCVIPFIIPDCIKIAFAWIIGERLKKALPMLTGQRAMAK